MHEGEAVFLGRKYFYFRDALNELYPAVGSYRFSVKAYRRTC